MSDLGEKVLMPTGFVDPNPYAVLQSITDFCPDSPKHDGIISSAPDLPEDESIVPINRPVYSDGADISEVSINAHDSLTGPTTNDIHPHQVLPKRDTKRICPVKRFEADSIVHFMSSDRMKHISRASRRESSFRKGKYTYGR